MTVSDFDAAMQQVLGHCEIAALTRSAKGSVLVGDGKTHVIEAQPVTDVVDTTGAGDLYASGVLYGLSHGLDLAACGEILSQVVVQCRSDRPGRRRSRPRSGGRPRRRRRAPRPPASC